jgi:hypothetical protein
MDTTTILEIFAVIMVLFAAINTYVFLKVLSGLRELVAMIQVLNGIQTIKNISSKRVSETKKVES